MAEDRKTVSDLLGSLEPGNLWKVAAAVCTLVSSAFALGAYVAGITSSSSTKVVACSDRKDYPKGLWYQTGAVESPPSSARLRVAPRIYFSDAQTITTQTTKDGEGVFEWVLETPIRPGEKIKAHGKNKPGAGKPNDQVTFSATWDSGLVSADGCYFEVQWSDSDGQRGWARATWAEPRRFYVER